MVTTNVQRKINFSKSDALYTFQKGDALYKTRNPECSFNAIKSYIQSCKAYKDPYSKIIIEDNAIYFGHSLNEIEASFPKLVNLIMVRPKSFSEDNVMSYGYRASDTFIKPKKPIAEKQKELVEEGKTFFSSFKKEISSKIINKNGSLEPKEVLLDLVDHNNTVVIGEVHNDRSSKKLLIDNMRQLKEKGVDTIYLEHVFYDTQKELFDVYFASNSLTMPTMLKDYLYQLDRGFFKDNPVGDNKTPYTFTGLVVQAKRHGIKIIPIDTVASYSTGSAHLLGTKEEKDPANRCLMMNYVAAKNYNETKSEKGKALFFIGSTHINSINSGITGLDKIANGPTLVIQDRHPYNMEVAAIEHSAQPDVLIYMTTELSEEAKQLNADLEKAYKEEESLIGKELEQRQKEHQHQQEYLHSYKAVFNESIATLNVKIKELIAKGSEGNPQYKFNYVEVGKKAKILCEGLEAARDVFFASEITLQTYEKFKESCTQTINKAKPEFAKHRHFWHQINPIIKNLLGVFALLLLGIPALVVEFKTKQGYVGTFFKLPQTDSLKKLEMFENELGNQLAMVSS